RTTLVSYTWRTISLLCKWRMRIRQLLKLPVGIAGRSKGNATVSNQVSCARMSIEIPVSQGTTAFLVYELILFFSLRTMFWTRFQPGLHIHSKKWHTKNCDC